jgi:hypothetical protein
VYSTLLFFPCYSNLLLRRRGWTGILRWGVLGYILPRLSFPWCYGVFRCSVLLRVIIVFRDTIYVIIIILYSWHLVICEHFWLYVWNNWSWVMHTMSTWFWHKTRYDSSPHLCRLRTDRLAPMSKFELSTGTYGILWGPANWVASCVNELDDTLPPYGCYMG